MNLVKPTYAYAASIGLALSILGLAASPAYSGQTQSLVRLQSTSPGTSQIGHINVSGQGLFGGRVGIGVNSPEARLAVNRDWDGEQGALDLQGDRPTLRFSGGALAGNESWIAHVGSEGPGNLAFFHRTGPAQWLNVLTFATTGRTGIGVATPVYQLDVFRTAGNAIRGRASAASGWITTCAVNGDTANGTGVSGTVNTGNGVEGDSSGNNSAGVFGGVLGTNSYAIRGAATDSSSYAGYFTGKVQVTGTLSKGGGSFKIDHPLDPQNKFLYHSFVESPDMKNIYDGEVKTDERGYATVAMPDWFDALNRDFRYQLTVVGEEGDAWVMARIVRRLKGNQFTIQTSQPRVTVSWQITGIRQDAFANAHRIPVEEDKPDSERGLYLYPAEHGVSKELGIDEQWLARQPRARFTRERSD